MQAKVIGAGLAGVEAAYYLANQGIEVKLYEMRPKKMTDAHQTRLFAELVCSNSFRSKDPLNAVGMLKDEMRQLNSLVMEAAELYEVSAGSSLAVDRTLFSTYITGKIINHPQIEVIHQEVTEIDYNEPTIIAAGPLVSNELKTNLMKIFGAKELNFYDAVAPIISEKSINKEICYLKSRYDKGKAAYLNCPLTKEEYTEFYKALINAEVAPLKDFEIGVFEGCVPFEVLAKRGFETLLYGPLKPVGLEYNNNKPYAVVQLRQDDAIKSMYNLVGFQTNLKFSEQKRLIQMIPGLEKAEILRYGVMHKNTYFNSPNILNPTYQAKEYPNLFLAGQISGVEGYLESASSGLSAAIMLARFLTKKELIPLPKETIIGSLAHYISTPNYKFNPMNANLGLLPNLGSHRKSERRKLYRKRSDKYIKKYLNEVIYE
ncbi:MAG: methylenetetrahydrofolate--tRNA-(uracil(54)-C(5))-methyltransferase (FADH(2)-oxidizing) TrmFO [Acholeplasmataceae bacterium]|jgi:methylenetetrahydrofolate--tRNA-(uracil-5-)-methyltransferase|nr:methylenetetrahydrofolate--tRNA-(uracil(54)-C(5))-methyltransferase (FADH(2)-oxidizing) TrmFO [Acholeplasmataceae bacterium]